MFSIKFIDNILMKDSKLCAEGRMGKTTKLLLRQGQLDGACGIYSLLMLLILHKKINSEDLKDETDHDVPQYVKRLKEQILTPLKGIRSSGTTLDYLREMLLKIFNGQILVSVYKNQEKGDDTKMLHYRIRNQLDAGYPVLIAYKKPNTCGHALVVIGYTLFEGNFRLYCLDPSFNISWCSYWNNIIDINITETDKDWPDYCHMSEKNVKVDEILMIEENKDVDLSWSFYVTQENVEPESDDKHDCNKNYYEYILSRAKQFHYQEWEYDELMKCVDMLSNLSRQELVSLYTSKWFKNEITLKYEILMALFGDEVVEPWLHFDEMSTDELIYKYEQRNHKFITVIREELRIRYKDDMGDDRIKIAAAFQNGTKGDQKWLEKQLRKLWSINDSNLPF